MLFRDVIDLIFLEENENVNGFPVTSIKAKRTIFANKKSVQRNEFYLASQQGFKLSLMFEIRAIEYNSENYLLFQEKQYEIVRAYEKGELMELVCQAYGDKN